MKKILIIVLIVIAVIVAVFAGLFYVTYSNLKSARLQADLRNIEAHIKSGLAVIRTEAEIVYDSKRSYSTVCTSSVNLKQVEVDSSNKANCVSGVDYFVVSAQLPTGDFYCVDNTGYLGKVNALQTGKACVQ